MLNEKRNKVLLAIFFWGTVICAGLAFTFPVIAALAEILLGIFGIWVIGWDFINPPEQCNAPPKNL